MSGASNVRVKPHVITSQPQDLESLDEWLARHKRRATLTTFGETLAALAALALLIGLVLLGSWVTGTH